MMAMSGRATAHTSVVPMCWYSAFRAASCRMASLAQAMALSMACRTCAAVISSRSALRSSSSNRETAMALATRPPLVPPMPSQTTAAWNAPVWNTA